MTWRAIITEKDYANSVVLKIGEAGPTGTQVFETATIRMFPEGEAIPPDLCFMEATPEMMTAILQAIVDAAFDHGIRPRAMEQGQDVRAHLEDMRKIVGKQLKVQL